MRRDTGPADRADPSGTDWRDGDDGQVRRGRGPTSNKRTAAWKLVAGRAKDAAHGVGSFAAMTAIAAARATRLVRCDD